MDSISSRKMFDSRGQTKTNEKKNYGSSLPVGYLKDGYFDKGSKVAKREYVLQYAQELANKLASEKPNIKKTQLRGFYDKVKYAWDNLENGNRTLEEAIGSVCDLSHLAHQSVGRSNAPKLFEDFINANVVFVVDYDSLKAFERHFRAIVCYYPENKR